ncbi:arginase family protein [Streptomyces sp. NPDC058067]|uniref:arginase family protein n=1 Tax=Streptomyces sp. NPDC058067 TaxID=3346324 RepID=UPI0036E3CA31
MRHPRGGRAGTKVPGNQGRPGAANGPGTLRGALASMAPPVPNGAVDVGDIEVAAGDPESGQRRPGTAITLLADRGHPVVVLGGGHEVAYGSCLGPAGTRAPRDGGRLGVLNLDLGAGNMVSPHSPVPRAQPPKAGRQAVRARTAAAWRP